MSRQINKEAFQALYKTARDSHEEAVASSPLFSRTSKRVQDAFQDTFGKATNAAEVVAKKAKLKFKVHYKSITAPIGLFHGGLRYFRHLWLILPTKYLVKKGDLAWHS